MKKFLIILMMCVSWNLIFAQNTTFKITDVDTQNPSAMKILVKTYSNKKKGVQRDAEKSVINQIIFDGLQETQYNVPLIPQNSKRGNEDIINQLVSNKFSDYIRKTTQLSDSQNAEEGEKSTSFEIIVDYNQLKLDIKKHLKGGGNTVADKQASVNQKKPTIMILPSDNWCSLRLYTTTFDNQGVKTKIPNYIQAFQDDQELPAVISKIGSILTDLGYSLKDAEQLVKSINARQAEDNMTSSKNQGASISESPLDMLKKHAKADIIIQLWWKINKEGSNKSISFTLEAFDAYTNKRIGTASATGNPSSEIVPALLEQAVKDNINDFDSQMLAFYDDINMNGREVILNIKKWDTWEEDLETEFDGMPLLEIIEEWLHNNTVNDSFNLSDYSDNFALFEQVRIPVINKSGRAIDAKSFVSGLQKHLKNTYGIPSKLMVRGLGETNLILGEQ